MALNCLRSINTRTNSFIKISENDRRCVVFNARVRKWTGRLLQSGFEYQTWRYVTQYLEIGIMIQQNNTLQRKRSKCCYGQCYFEWTDKFIHKPWSFLWSSLTLSRRIPELFGKPFTWYCAWYLQKGLHIKGKFKSNDIRSCFNEKLIMIAHFISFLKPYFV